MKRWKLNKKQAVLLAGILLLALAASSRSLFNGLVSDDHHQIIENPSLRNWSTVWETFGHDNWWHGPSVGFQPSIYYRPFWVAYLTINFHLFGQNIVAWHVATILLHVLVVLLSFRAAQILTDDVNMALVSAMIFAVLPCHAETVAWVSAAGEPLSAGCMFAAFYLIAREPANFTSRIAAPLLFAGALLTHEGAILFPLIIAFYFLLLRPATDFPASERPSGVSQATWALVHSAPLFALSFGYLALRWAVLGPAGFLRNPEAGQPELAHRIATMPAAVWSYVQVLALPWLAGPAHPVNWVVGFASSEFYLALMALVLLASGFYFAIRGSYRRNLYLFCAVWWLLGLAPALNLIRVSPTLVPVQDRYLYFPSFGFCVLAADYLMRVYRAGQGMRVAAEAIATCTFALYLAAFWTAQRYWRDDLSMLGRSVAVFSNSIHYRELLAGELDRRGDLEGAKLQYSELIRLAPDKPLYHFYLGFIEQRLGEKASAEVEFHRSIPKPDQR